jgi:hypothetical protein
MEFVVFSPDDRIQTGQHDYRFKRKKVMGFEPHQYLGRQPTTDSGEGSPSGRQSRVDAYLADAAAVYSDGAEKAVRKRLLGDLLEIEAALKVRKKRPITVEPDVPNWPHREDTAVERRQHRRVIYPMDRCPKFSFGGRFASILDLSHAGMRLQADTGAEGLNIVRGIIEFYAQPSMPVTGKVVWKDDLCVGLRLLTRIGHRRLEREGHLLRT